MNVLSKDDIQTRNVLHTTVILGGWRSLQWCWKRFKSSWILRCVNWQIVTDVSECDTFMFKVKQSKMEALCSPETSPSIYQPTRRNVSEGLTLLGVLHFTYCSALLQYCRQNLNQTFFPSRTSSKTYPAPATSPARTAQKETSTWYFFLQIII